MASSATRLSDDEIAVVGAASTAVSVLSIVGSWSIVVCYMRYAHLRKFSMTIVLMLSLSDIGNQIADFLNPSADSMDAMQGGAPITAQCLAQGILDSFFELSSVTWTSAIAAVLYMSVFQRKSAEEVQARFWQFCCVCFGFPALMAVLPLADNSYGPSGAWCWVTKDAWRFAQFYVPLWICIAFNSVIYVRVLRLLRATLQSAGPSDATAATIRKFTARLQWYPFILVIVWFFASVNRLYEAAGGAPLFWLYLLQRVFSSSQGLCNALAYGLTSEGVAGAVQDDLAATFPACCGHLGSARRARGGASVLEDASASSSSSSASGSNRGRSTSSSAGSGAGGKPAAASGGLMLPGLSSLVSAASGSGSGGGGGDRPPPHEEDTLAAAHGHHSSSESWRRLKLADGGAGAVDDRVIAMPPPPPPPRAVVVPNPLTAAAATAPAPPGGAAAPSAPVASREDRVRALQQGGALPPPEL